MSKTFIFVPQTAELAIYKLTESELIALLSSLPGGFVEVEAGTGVYKVNDLSQLTETYSSLFSQK